MATFEVDTPSTANAGRNNGPVPSSARKRSRNSSKNNSTLALTAPHSSMITSSDDGAGSSDESSGEDMQTNDEHILKQLRSLQEQVKINER